MYKYSFLSSVIWAFQLWWHFWINECVLGTCWLKCYVFSLPSWFSAFIKKFILHSLICFIMIHVDRKSNCDFSTSPMFSHPSVIRETIIRRKKETANCMRIPSKSLSARKCTYLMSISGIHNVSMYKNPAYLLILFPEPWRNKRNHTEKERNSGKVKWYFTANDYSSWPVYRSYRIFIHSHQRDTLPVFISVWSCPAHIWSILRIVSALSVGVRSSLVFYSECLLWYKY